MAIPRRRLVFTLAGTVALVAVLALGANAVFGVRSGGPLEANSMVAVAWPVEPGEDYTWGMPMSNLTQGNIVMETIEPVGIQGLEILGVMVGNNVPGSAKGYPPIGLDLDPREPEGAVIRPLTESGEGLDIVIGVRLSPGEEVGTIDGIRIRYRAGRTTYETVLTWSLRLMTQETYEDWRSGEGVESSDH